DRSSLLVSLLPLSRLPFGDDGHHATGADMPSVNAAALDVLGELVDRLLHGALSALSMLRARVGDLNHLHHHYAAPFSCATALATCSVGRPTRLITRLDRLRRS